MSLRVLVIDDSALYRKIVTEALRGIPNVEIIGSAYSGRSALDRVSELKPDVVTVDLEMPDMDGIELVRQLKQEHPALSAIMVSAFTDRGSSRTISALEAGAIDFVTKNTEGSPDEQLSEIRDRLRQVLLVVSMKVRSNPTFAQKPAARAPVESPAAPPQTKGGLEMLLVGVSTGGPVALGKLLPALGTSLGVPVFIVQHMPPLFTKHLAESLDKKCGLHIKEAEEGDQPKKDTVYIAPGGKHMRLEKSPEGSPLLRLTEDPPENNCRPAVDVLFRSAAHNFPGKSAAVILTGMGSDGTRGLQLLKRHGCTSIGQDKESCVVYGMPGEAMKAGVIDQELPLSRIAPAILDLFRIARV